MKKFIKVLSLSCILSSFFTLTAFAGAWLTAKDGWWYRYDDGSYPTSQWVWLDGDNDGVSECYYFNERGYLITNTHSPDGCYVDANGAWVDSGRVQTRGQKKQASRFRRDWIYGVYQCHDEYLDAEMELGYYSDSGAMYIRIEGNLSYSPYSLGAFTSQVVYDTGNNSYYAVGTGGDYIKFTYNGVDGINITDSIIEHDSGSRFRSFKGNYHKTQDGFES